MRGNRSQAFLLCLFGPLGSLLKCQLLGPDLLLQGKLLCLINHIETHGEAWGRLGAAGYAGTNPRASLGGGGAVGMHQLLVEQFIASFKEAPSELILDFDATDDRVHGNQEGRFFHGYYGSYCFLPLYHGAASLSAGATRL